MALAPTHPPMLDAPVLPAPAPRRWRAASDEFLVRSAARGNEGALAAIHDRYRASLERYCRTILLHQADAEDAAQAALAAALRALADGRARPHALRAWLYKIAHREALAVLRRRPPVPAGEEALELVCDGREERAATRERLGELLDGLRALPERQRGALVLHEVAGLTFSEVGETLSISSGAARQAAYEARTRLRTRRAELQALFPAGPALALAAGGGAALATGAAATTGAGALGTLGSWLTGASVATKCAAVCAAIGAIGAGSLSVAPSRHDVDRERPARAAATPSAPLVSAPAGAANALPDPRAGVTMDARPAARPPTGRAPERAPERRRTSTPAGVEATPQRQAQPQAPDVTSVTVQESPTGGQVPHGTTTPPAHTPTPAPSSAPQTPDTQAVVVESSAVGSGVVTGAPSEDVVSVLVE